MSASRRLFHWATLNSVSLSCKIFGKNTTRSEAKAWRFFSKPEGLDLAGQWDTELPLPNEIIVCGINIYSSKI